MPRLESECAKIFGAYLKFSGNADHHDRDVVCLPSPAVLSVRGRCQLIDATTSQLGAFSQLKSLQRNSCNVVGHPCVCNADLVDATVAGPAVGDSRRQAGYRRALAPPGLPYVLAVEIIRDNDDNVG